MATAITYFCDRPCCNRQLQEGEILTTIVCPGDEDAKGVCPDCRAAFESWWNNAV